MNNSKKTITSIIGVTLSNCTTILSGIVIGFLIPKILSVDSYGLYKTFTLYTTYIGFFSLGIIDGIVLDYGGYNFEQLNKEKFRSFFKWYMFVHFIGFIVLAIISFFLKNSDFKFIILLLGIDMIAVNVTGYYQQISQFTQRFREYSIRKVLQSASNIVIVLLMFGYYYTQKSEIGYQIYVFALVLVNVLLTVWYVYTYRSISFGKSERMSDTRGEVIHLIKIGFPLLFANLCATLILTLDRQFVNILFDTSTYAVYAFAYNMLSLVTVATSAIATVLYPTLKRSTKESMVENYPRLIALMLLLVFAANAVYFPLCWFVKWFLPKYNDSLVIFRIIFPGLAISSAVTVVMHNYYKVLGKNLRYFFKSLIVLGISALANGIAYVTFKTPASISVASIITMVIWYVFIEQYFVKEIGYKRWKNLIYLLFMITIFYATSAISNMWLGFLIYIVVYSVVTYLLFKNLIISSLRKVFERKV